MGFGVKITIFGATDAILGDIYTVFEALDAICVYQLAICVMELAICAYQLAICVYLLVCQLLKTNKK